MQIGLTGIAHVNFEHMTAISIRYELMALEEFIKVQFVSAETEDGLTAAKIKRWEQFVVSESKKVRANMTGQVLSLAKPRHIELYIQHHQAGLIHLSDTLWLYARKRDVSRLKNRAQFLTNVQQELSGLLDFLKHYFDTYFDCYQHIPRYCIEQNVKSIFGTYLKILEGQPLKDYGILLASLKEYIASIVSGEQYQLSFHIEAYFEAFFKVAFQEKKGIYLEEELIELLLQFNYNDSRFMDYCRHRMISELGGLENDEEQLSFLAERIKQLKQIPVRKVAAFTPSNPDIIAYCQQWMEEEYQFIQNRMRMQQVGNDDRAHLIKQGVKMETILPVSQLGILLQLIHNSGAIRLKNKTAFIDFFAQHMVTKDKEKISGKNLRNSYYNIDSRSVPFIKDLLYAMLKQLREFE